MVEMRWEVRKRGLDALVLEGSVSRTYRVLQYRVYHKFEGAVSEGMKWTEWMDVPEVSAE